VLPLLCVICDAVEPTFDVVSDYVKGDPSGVLTTVRCPSCSHVQLHPPIYDLSLYERDGQVASVIAGYGTPISKLLEHSWVEARRRADRFGEHGHDLAAIGSDLNLLDVGGGYGLFGSEVLRRNPAARVTVMEPSTMRVEIGRTEIARSDAPWAMPVFEVALLDDEFAKVHEGSFDVVTMWHVVEHVPSPVSLLRLALRLLRPGTGRLCIEVPNFADDLLGLSPAYLQRHFMAEHISYFTPATLEAVARRAAPRADVTLYGHQRYGIYNYFHWAHFNEPQGASPDMFPGKDRWWLETEWRTTKENALTSDALYMVVQPG
jgi:2-polyprenyl-3-methyl-5-hydroxy-6-metoxy-1,4-benzoquinol methylase